MKRTFKYSLILLSLFSVLSGCKDDELIPSKDTYDGYKGVTGDFAYIVGGTMPEYDAVTAEVQHTPLGEMGEVERIFDVALTKAQDSEVTISIDVDNSALTAGYDAFPEGTLSFEKTVRIPAGSLSATVKVTVSISDFPKLTGQSYMAVFRIVGTSGVSISTNSNRAVLYATVETVDPAENKISISSNTLTYNVTNYTDTQRGDDISTEIMVSGTKPAFQQFDVKFVVDNDLIAEYNKDNGTSYVSVPDGVVTIVNATMEKDAKSAVASVSIDEENRKKLTDENGYLIPVRIEDVADATLSEESGIVYLVINVANFDTPSNFFSALYLGNSEMATWYKFQEGMDLSQGYTYIFHIFIDEITDHSRIGDFSDANEGWINMLRFGQLGNKDTRLEWWVGPGDCRKKLYAPAIEAKKWYQYALVYDLKSYKLFLEKEKVAEVELTEEEQTILKKQPPVFQAIEFNSSWVKQYREGDAFHGRLWNFSVWKTDLASEDIEQCYRGMAPVYLYYYLPTYGSYWEFNDGHGHIVKQTAGIEMGDIDFSKTTRVENESPGTYEDADVSEYVEWKTDEYNKFDE